MRISSALFATPSAPLFTKPRTRAPRRKKF
jgi:hypothetical protein